MLRAGRTAIDDAYRQGYLSESVADHLKADVDSRLVLGSEDGWPRVWGVETEGEEGSESSPDSG